MKGAQKEFCFIPIRFSDLYLVVISLKKMIAVTLPPIRLLVKEIFDLPSAWVDPNILFNSRGAAFQQHSSRRVTMALFNNGINYLSEDINEAVQVQMTQVIVTGSRKMLFDLQVTTSIIIAATDSGGNSGSRNRLAHDNAMSLKDSDEKFFGDLREYWMDCFYDYSLVARSSNISAICCLGCKAILPSRRRGVCSEFLANCRHDQPGIKFRVRQTRVRKYVNNIKVK